MNPVPDALAPSFIYKPDRHEPLASIKIGSAIQQTGLIDNPTDRNLLDTPVWGYGDYKALNLSLGRDVHSRSIVVALADLLKHRSSGITRCPASSRTGFTVDTTLHFSTSA